MQKTLVLGLGNPIVSDDGVGIYAVRELLKHFSDEDIIKYSVDVKEASVGGFDLVDLISGYERVIIIDAIKTGRNPPGYILKLRADDIITTFRLAYIHEIDLPMALELGRKLNLSMPEKIIILAVEAENLDTFSDKLTAEVEKVIPEVIEMILDLIKNN